VILAVVDDRDIFLEGGSVSIVPPDAKLARLFARPAKALEATEEVVDGIPFEDHHFVRVMPGTGQHFRAVVRTIAGARVILDDGDA